MEIKAKSCDGLLKDFSMENTQIFPSILQLFKMHISSIFLTSPKEGSFAVLYQMKWRSKVEYG